MCKAPFRSCFYIPSQNVRHKFTKSIKIQLRSLIADIRQLYKAIARFSPLKGQLISRFSSNLLISSDHKIYGGRSIKWVPWTPGDLLVKGVSVAFRQLNLIHKKPFLHFWKTLLLTKLLHFINFKEMKLDFLTESQ